MSKRESGRKREGGNVQKYEIVIYQNDEQEKRKRTHSEDWSKERKIAKEWLLWVVAANVLLSGFFFDREHIIDREVLNYGIQISQQFVGIRYSKKAGLKSVHFFWGLYLANLNPDPH